MNDTILINRLPTRTWNRLGVNETAIAWGQADDLGEEKITAAGQTERLEITGSGERGEKMVDIHVPAGQTVTVFETLRAEKGLLVRTALHVEKDAKVRLVQIQNAAQGSLLRLETSGECAENGQVELIQVLLGRGDVYSDGQFELNGNGAGFTAGIGYLGQKQQTVDMNLVVNHWDQKTTSEINAAGALKDDAKKIFRGTIRGLRRQRAGDGFDAGRRRRQQDGAADPVRRGKRRRQPRRDHRRAGRGHAVLL